MKTNGYQGLGAYDDPYHTLRLALAPDYAGLAPAQLDALVKRTFGAAVTAEDVEEVLDSIEEFARQVGHRMLNVVKMAAPVEMNAEPGAPHGAMLGSTGSTGQKGPIVAVVAGAVPGMIGPEGQHTQPLLGVPTAAHLLYILSRPEVFHAL